MDWTTVVASAAVGALVAGVFQIVSQHLNGRRRRRELVFRMAFEAARAQRRNALLASRTTGRSVQLRDPLYVAAEYHRLVAHLYDSGTLPHDAKPERTA